VLTKLFTKKSEFPIQGPFRITQVNPTAKKESWGVCGVETNSIFMLSYKHENCKMVCDALNEAWRRVENEEKELNAIRFDDFDLENQIEEVYNDLTGGAGVY
jgi:hypothetical protein